MGIRIAYLRIGRKQSVESDNAAHTIPIRMAAAFTGFSRVFFKILA